MFKKSLCLAVSFCVLVSPCVYAIERTNQGAEPSRTVLSDDEMKETIAGGVESPTAKIIEPRAYIDPVTGELSPYSSQAILSWQVDGNWMNPSQGDLWKNRLIVTVNGSTIWDEIFDGELPDPPSYTRSGTINPMLLNVGQCSQTEGGYNTITAKIVQYGITVPPGVPIPFTVDDTYSAVFRVCSDIQGPPEG